MIKIPRYLYNTCYTMFTKSLIKWMSKNKKPLILGRLLYYYNGQAKKIIETYLELNGVII